MSFWIFGRGVLAVRAITAGSAVLCTLLLYLVLGRLGFRYGAFLGAAAWNVQTLALNFTRWGFSHGLAGTLILAAFFFLLEADASKKVRHLCWASLLMGAAVTMTYWVAPAVLVVLTALIGRHRWRGAAASVGLALPMALLVLLAMALWGPADVYQDVRRLVGGTQMASAASSVRTLGRTLNALARGYANVLGVDAYTVCGTIGLLCLRRVWHKVFAISLLIVLGLLPVLSAGDILHTFFYRAMTFCPLLFVGFGALCDRMYGALRTVLSNIGPRPTRYIGAVALLVGGVWLARAYGQRARAVAQGIATPIDVFCVENIHDTRATIEFLNNSREAGYFVIASPMVAHGCEGRALLPHDVAKFLTMGDNCVRYIHDLSLANAQFFVVDRLLYVHTLRSNPVTLELAWKIERGRWPLVWSKGEYRVYANPSLSGAGLSSGPFYRIGAGEFYTDLAHKGMQRKQHREALDCLSRALDMNPEDADLMNMMAVANAHLLRFSEALEWLNRSLAISPSNAVALRNRKSMTRAWRDQRATQAANEKAGPD